MRDGVRRVTHVTEVIGMEGDVIITQDLFTFEFKGEDGDGKLFGELNHRASARIVPRRRRISGWTRHCSKP